MLTSDLSQAMIECLVTRTQAWQLRQALEHIDPFLVQLINFPWCDHRAGALQVDQSRQLHRLDLFMAGRAFLRCKLERIIQVFFLCSMCSARTFQVCAIIQLKNAGSCDSSVRNSSTVHCVSAGPWLQISAYQSNNC